MDKHCLHVDEFIREFLHKRISTKNAFESAAGRLCFIRRFLRTQMIPFNLVLSVMERHQQMISDDNRSITAEEMGNLLHDIYYAGDKLSLIAEPYEWQQDVTISGFDADYQGSLLASFINSVFESSRTISLLELKTALLLLCGSSSVEELVQHHLNLLIDHNRCIHQTRFKVATGAILKLFHRLNDSICCDSDTLLTLVGNSFAKVTGLAGLSDTQFYHFWNTENRKNSTEISYFLSLILFSRSLDVDVIHEGVSCSGCSPNTEENDTSVITGLRFKCTRCSTVNLCTLCYLGDYQSGRHNPSTHKFTIIQEAEVFPDMDNRKRGDNLLTKLLKVFHIARIKRSRNLNVDEDVVPSVQEVPGEAVKTIRFLDETPRNKVVAKADGKDKLLTVIEMLSTENRLFQENLEQIQQTCSPDGEFHKYLEQHKNILTAQIQHLQEIWKSSGENEKEQNVSILPSVQQQKFHSTPFRKDLPRSINWDLTGLDASTGTVTNGTLFEGDIQGVSKQIRGEEMDKTYYEANRSNRSLQEISTWLHLRDSFCREMISGSMDKSVTKSPLDSSGMQSFRELLHKVKDILEDTYSDNAELSTVTRQLEDALDEIIGKEERVFLQKKERTLERVKRT